MITPFNIKIRSLIMNVNVMGRLHREPFIGDPYIHFNKYPGV